jgi:alkanesulfonate monooxygenase SsuD/methylene tetrahydromethanopterin reductase-like flavin-dependent oxidoreductase (luciferase family)
MTARMAGAVDDLSGGRLTLGLGAGWQEREHHNYGWDLLDIPGRFARFEEGLEIITRLLHRDTPFDFSGQFYQLHEAILLPRPQRADGPPVLIGGNGAQRTLPLVARYADEWNAVFRPAAKIAELSSQLDGLLEQNGRRADEVRRSLMTELVFGRDEAEVQRKLRGRESAEELRQMGRVVGTPAEIVEQLGRLSEVGVQRVMLQWLDLDDLDGLEAMAQTVLPQL